MSLPAASALPVRAAVKTDAPELARLLTALGHGTTAGDIAERWTAWTTEGNEALVLAEAGGLLRGAITLHRMTVLHRPQAVGRVTALIVDAEWRGQGLGRRLLQAAEARLKAAGCGLIEITSHRRLVDAHAFYQRLGYEHTSLRLSKSVDAGS